MAEQYEKEQERLDYRTAVIASDILNTIPRTKNNKNKVFTPADIFPGYGWGQSLEEKIESQRQRTPDEIFEYYRALAERCGSNIMEN